VAAFDPDLPDAFPESRRSRARERTVTAHHSPTSAVPSHLR
jgi:hypothetical protein